MKTSQELIETYLDDLQSEMEAGGRQVDRIRATLLEQQFKQAAAMGELVRRLEELRASVRQQRDTLGALRTQMRAGRRHNAE
jgi:Mg2+ and Co2+ transporter CorA